MRCPPTHNKIKPVGANLVFAHVSHDRIIVHTLIGVKPNQYFSLRQKTKQSIPAHNIQDRVDKFSRVQENLNTKTLGVGLKRCPALY